METRKRVLPSRKDMGQVCGAKGNIASTVRKGELVNAWAGLAFCF